MVSSNVNMMKDQANIRIISKQLPSGNQQVKFFIEDKDQPRYGYLLVYGTKSTAEVIEEIRERLEMMVKAKMDLLRFSFKRPWQDDHNFYIYRL